MNHPSPDSGSNGLRVEGIAFTEYEHLRQNEAEFALWVLERQLEVAVTYVSGDIADVGLVELREMLIGNARVRKCGHCGRYFLVQGRADTRYCDRIAMPFGKTCKDVGPMKKYADKLVQDH